MNVDRRGHLNRNLLFKENNMEFFKKLLLVLALFSALSIAGVGCKDNNTLEDAGDEIGETMEDAGDAVKDATN